MGGDGATLWDSLFQNANTKAARLFGEYKNALEPVETIYSNAYYNRLTVARLFDKSVREQFNESIPKLATLSNELTDVVANKIKSSERENFITIREELDKRVSGYAQMLDLYNKIYAAMYDDDLGRLESVDAQDNGQVEYIVGRFVKYISERDRLESEMDALNCTIISTEDNCLTMRNNYNAFVAEFMQNSRVANAVLKAYDGETVYNDDSLLLPKIENFLKEVQ